MSLAMAAHQRARGWRADEPVVESVFPFTEQAFPDDTTGIWYIGGMIQRLGGEGGRYNSAEACGGVPR